MVDGSILVLYQAGVVALIRRHHALHDQGPVLGAHLDTGGRGFWLQAKTQTLCRGNAPQELLVTLKHDKDHKELVLNEEDEKKMIG